jgi:transcriptional regulator with XRE-family HTH domain
MRAARAACESWERFFVSTVREQVLSEFIDAWNAGKRPDVDEYIARVPAEEQGALSEELMSFLSLAPTPAYSVEALAAIEAEPAVVEALRGSVGKSSLLPDLLSRLRTRFGMSTDDVAGELVGELGLADDRQPKTAGYLERLEQGRLEPARVSRRVFEALGRIFGLAGSELEGAADAGGWAPIPAPAAAAAPVFRAEKDAAAAASKHLEAIADALAAPGGEPRDEVDELFLGGR